MVPASSLLTWINLPPALADGSEAHACIRHLAFNSRYLHPGLKKLGFIIYGHSFSPIVPLLIFNPGKLPTFVPYPATPFETARAWFCPSASHTKEDIDIVLRAYAEVGEILDLKHGSGKQWGINTVCERAVELVHSVNI
ncbi:hypothetical protein C8R48DRAFT_774642 [Suillus tomentosus]|nr:hypothetical protein C8R48DRAFT_774642 [Suillus tomentosus]